MIAALLSVLLSLPSFAVDASASASAKATEDRTEGKQEDYTVTLRFEKIHCDECKSELEGIVRKVPGYKSHLLAETSVTVMLAEKAPVPAFGGLPKDMGFRGATVTLRGTVNFTGDKAVLVAKGSGHTLTLANPEKSEKRDRIGDLKKALGGKNRFQVTGLLMGKTLVLESFQPAEWKD